MDQIKLVLAVWALAIAFVNAADDPQGGYYHSKYDYVDIQDLLNHKRLVTHYVSCLLGRGPCPPEGMDLKRILPEALRTNCLRCTEKQKEAIHMGIKRIRVEYPNLWKELLDAFDPNEQYISKIEASFAQTTSEEDQANLLANRFSEDDNSANNLVPNLNSTPDVRPYSGTSPETTTTTSTTTVTPFTSQTGSVSTVTATSTKTTTTRPLTTRPPTTRPPTNTPTTTRPPTTRPPTTRPPTTRPPTTTSTTTKTSVKPSSTPPSFYTIWQVQTSTKPPTYGWRPVDATTQNVFFRPFQTIQPLDITGIKVDSGVRLLGSISDLGNKVLLAGSQVAGMVLSTVQALVGQ